MIITTRSHPSILIPACMADILLGPFRLCQGHAYTVTVVPFKARITLDHSISCCLPAYTENRITTQLTACSNQPHWEVPILARFEKIVIQNRGLIPNLDLNQVRGNH